MPNEKQTDFIVANLLKNANINFFPNGSDVLEIENALKTASKRGTNKQGFPEFTAVVNDFVIVVEDKADKKFQANYLGGNTLLMDTPSITKFAENGALHYALNILEKTNFKKIIAFGCSGEDEKKISIRPIFVNPNGYKILPYEKNFINFSVANIERYYQEKILENKPLEQVELEDIISRSKKLNEDLRKYGHLGDLEKPLVVSAVLLALSEPGFFTENLIGDKIKTDGEKIFEALSTHMDRVKVSPQTKKSQVLDQFRMIKNRPHLSDYNENLGKSPLKYFAEYLDSNVITAIVNNSPEDVLGRFYSEFIRYSGEGQKLGVVLTPKHITELFCDLVKIQPTDKVFDPCCGTGGFLISAMSRMLNLAKTDEEKIFIKKNNIHGIEQRDDMFSIATTNMILRGDGKSNLVCGDFLKKNIDELREKNFTVGFMNPPYSQAKDKSTKHLSELKFISHLLDSLGENALCVVIVPQSTMVGKTSEDKSDKKYILENHTLEGVITLNPQTFSTKVGTNPVIAVFTAHKPHDAKKLVKFVDFKDDGYEIFPHIGLLATADAPKKKEFLLRCWHEGMTAPTSFIIRTEIKPDDEWLHSFYYFNEEIPTEKDFEKTMADYLTFEFNMIVHGRGYLFDDEKKKFVTEKNLPSLENKTWKDFLIKDLFDVKIGKAVIGNTVDKNLGKVAYITRKETLNGIDGFIDFDEKFLNSNFPVITVGAETAQPFVQTFPFFTGVKVNIMTPKKFLSKYVLQFIAQVLQMQKKNYCYSFAMISSRLKKLSIKLPVDEKNLPDWEYMENYMRQIEEKLLKLYQKFILPPPPVENDVILSEKKVWKEFFIEEIAEIFSGRDVYDAERFSGKNPYIGASANNNGICHFVGNENSTLEKNCISVNRNGSVGYAFYHDYEALYSNDCRKIRPRMQNKYSSIFIAQQITLQREKYGYGYKMGTGRLKRQKILLPVDEKNLPDWDYMEKYMRWQEKILLKKYFDKKFA